MPRWKGSRQFPFLDPVLSLEWEMKKGKSNLRQGLGRVHGDGVSWRFSPLNFLEYGGTSCGFWDLVLKPDFWAGFWGQHC